MAKKLAWPKCEYRCKSCDFKWKGYRFLSSAGKIKDNGGMGETVCPKCQEPKIDWLNFHAVKVWYWRNVADGGLGGPNNGT